MTVYTCSPDLASILTCIYEAWNSRLGYRNVRLMTEPVGNLELFCDYCHVEPDTEKAASVTRSIQKKIGAAAWRLVYLCAMSERSDAPDIIYRFLLYGFSYGKDTLHMLQEPAVFHAFEVSRQVTNEAHSFWEFIRFANISSGFPILVSHISPKANVLTLVAPHFSDRLPSENWMILDDNRQLAVVHPADRPFYLTRLSPDEIERLSLTESTSDPYEELWKGFFTAIAIKERSNPDCQRTHLPLHYRIICRNLKIFRVLEFFQLFHVQHKHSTASCLGINRNRVISARAEVSAFHRGGRIGNCFPKPCFLF